MKPATVLFLLMATTTSAGNEWHTGAASMPTPRKEINNATVAMDGLIYVVGGVQSDGSMTGTLEIYDPTNDSWTEGAPLPTPIWRSSAAAVDGRIYLFGGYRSLTSFPFSPTSNAWVYDPALDSWTSIAPMPEARGSLVAVARAGVIHVIGGATSSALTLHRIYDPVANTWSSAAALPGPRSGLTGDLVGNEIYIVGGYFLGNGVVPQPTLFIYDASLDSWRQGPPMPVARLGMDAALSNGRLLVFGGAASPAIPSRALRFDPADQSWTQLADMPDPVSFMGVASIDHQVHVIGGGATNLNRFDGLAVNRRYEPAGADFSINAGMTGAWFNQATPGQGILIEVLSDSNQVFLAWFTYETVGAKVGAAEHRWLTALGDINGDRSDMTLINSSGGIFDNPATVTNTTAGSVSLSFSDCENGRMDYSLDDGPAGGFDLVRLAPNGVCQSLTR